MNLKEQECKFPKEVKQTNIMNLINQLSVQCCYISTKSTNTTSIGKSICQKSANSLILFKHNTIHAHQKWRTHAWFNKRITPFYAKLLVIRLSKWNTTWCSFSTLFIIYTDTTNKPKLPAKGPSILHSLTRVILWKNKRILWTESCVEISITEA